MTSKDRTQNIKTNAANLLVSLTAETLSLPMTWVAQQMHDPKITQHFRRLTIGGFLNKVCVTEGNIPKPYCGAVEALSSIFSTNDSMPVENTNSLNSRIEDVSTIAVFGKGETPLFERILEAINGALNYMNAGVRKGSERQAALIEHFCNQSGDYEVTAATFGCSRQNVEGAVKKFNTLLLEGKAWDGLDGLYIIASDLLKDIHELAHTLPGRLLGGLTEAIGAVEGTQLDYILRMLDCEVAIIGNREFIIERRKTDSYTKMATTARRALSKSVEAIPFSELSEGLSSGERAFLRRYLSIASGVKFLEGDNVIMTGKNLDKAVRQARIIYEADGWISKDEIAARYEAEYGEPMGAFITTSLHKLGCTNHNKLGYWMYGNERVGKVKDIIRTIITPEKPIATYTTIFKAVRANGLLYPETTIRACITDLACPENRNHDLFCLKGYTHLFPTLSWRSYKKQPA